MRKFLPFVGIAVAVAGGVALAPYFWWAAPLAGLVALCWWQRRYWPFAVILAAYGWPGWLASRQQYADTVFAALLVTLLFFWKYIVAWTRPYWLRVFPD